MDPPSDNLIRFKVRQAIGSMAIEGIQLSKEMQDVMLRIAMGQLCAVQVRAALVAKYRQAPTN